VLAILRVIAARGDARAADVLRAEGLAAFRNVAHARADSERPNARPAAEPIGLHPLRNSAFALGVAPAFGHAQAGVLADLVRAASANGLCAVRPTPGRALLLMGLRQATALAAEAERLGFVVRPDDPRRRIVACPGQPACASGLIPSRAIAADIARAAKWPGGGPLVHVSGCRKGCAHPAPAALTIVGTEHGCGIIHDGSARATPRTYAAPATIAADIATLGASEAAHA
jgi:precorrin-3B synthase